MADHSEPAQEQAIQEIARELKNGRVAFFLGAGANMCGREAKTFLPHVNLPSGKELAEHILDGYHLPKERDYSRDLARASEYAVLRSKQRSIYALLHDVFDVDFEPGPVHRFVADLRRLCGHHQYIVTTNYDDVMERGLALAGQPFDVIWYDAAEKASGQRTHGFFHLHLPDDFPYPTTTRQNASLAHHIKPIQSPTEFVDIPFAERSIIFKVHGEVWRWGPRDLDHDSYVITEDDYIEYLAFTRQFPQGLVSELKERDLLFLGYSLSDWNMRAFLTRVWQEQRLSTNSWAVLDQADELEREVWEHRGVKFLIMDLEEFTRRLRATLAPLVATAGGAR